MKTLKAKNLNVLSTLFICAFALQGSAQVKKIFTINGQITNMIKMPSQVYLIYNPLLGKPVDSTSIKNGKYTFKGNVDAVVPSTISFQPKSDNDYLTLMLDQGQVDIVSNGLLSNSLVTGSGPSTTANAEYRKLTSDNMKESAAVKKLIESDAYKTDAAVKKEVSRRTSNLIGNTMVSILNYIQKNPSSPITPYYSYGLAASGFLIQKKTDSLIQAFPLALKNTSLGKAMDSVILKRKNAELEAIAKRKALEDLTPLGSKAIEFTQNDVNGKPVSLSSFKGKYVLIDFWASWCGPCRGENPNVVKAFNDYKDKGFTVLGVSLDAASQKDKWLEAIEKDGLTWTQVSDLKGGNNAAAKLYGVESIPQNFLVDPNGIIVAKNLRGDALDEKLAELIK